jgi:hypothetical protein
MAFLFYEVGLRSSYGQKTHPAFRYLKNASVSIQINLKKGQAAFPCISTAGVEFVDHTRMSFLTIRVSKTRKCFNTDKFIEGTGIQEKIFMKIDGRSPEREEENCAKFVLECLPLYVIN